MALGCLFDAAHWHRSRAFAGEELIASSEDFEQQSALRGARLAGQDAGQGAGHGAAPRADLLSGVWGSHALKADSKAPFGWAIRVVVVLEDYLSLAGSEAYWRRHPPCVRWPRGGGKLVIHSSQRQPKAAGGAGAGADSLLKGVLSLFYKH